MPAGTGINVLLSIGDGAGPEVFTDLQGQRDCTLTRQTGTVDASHKKSLGWRKNLPHFRNWGVSGETLHIPDDPQYQALENAWNNKTQINVRLTDSGGNTYTGPVTVSDFSLQAPMEDMAITTLELEGSDVLVKA